MTERNPDSERSEEPGPRDAETTSGAATEDSVADAAASADRSPAAESTAGEGTAGEGTAAESAGDGRPADGESTSRGEHTAHTGREGRQAGEEGQAASQGRDGTTADGGSSPEDSGQQRPRPDQAEEPAPGRDGPGTHRPEGHGSEAEAPEADEPEKSGPAPRREASLPPDEEAAWAEIVAAYGEEPDADTLKTDGTDGPDAPDASAGPVDAGDSPAPPRNGPGGSGGQDGPGTPVRSFTVYAAGTGPRDWALDDEDEDDEGHFVPPEPPPLPEADTTTKFAWIAVLGGPLLLFACILTQQDLTWWIVTLGLGGFLGGFGTLVARMRDGRDDDDWNDPGRGAVV